jgi:cell division protease FtsH
MNAARTALFWLVIVVSAFLLWQVVKSGGTAQAVPEISYSEFLTRVTSGRVSRVTIAGSVVRGSDAKGGNFRVIAPPNESVLLETLQQHGVEIWFKETSEQGWPNMVLNLFPLIVLAMLWFYLVREKQKRRLAEKGPADSVATQDSKPALARDLRHFPLFPRFRGKRSKIQEG